MAFNRGKQNREVEQISKKRLSAECSLQLAYMKSELLVIVCQHTTVNTFPGLVPVSYTHLLIVAILLMRRIYKNVISKMYDKQEEVYKRQILPS